MDDVLVRTDKEEGHDKIVAEVLKQLEENNLYMKPEKCSWKMSKMNFLGVVMGQRKIEIEEKKLERVLNWSKPKMVRNVRKFLGLANYYRQFIKNFVMLVRYLNILTRKEEKWRWEEAQQKAFKQLKEIFITRLLLVAPDLDKEFSVEANASNFATRGILSIKCKNNK